jgi:pimeloyl-ACP methyl ester carboxylesterase
MKYTVLFLSIFIAFTQSAAAQQKNSLAGDWKGFINKGSHHLPIKIHFNSNNDHLEGTIRVQGVKLPLQKIKILKNDSVYFQFATNVNIAKFKGIRQSDSTMTGHYYQAGHQLKFKLKRYTPQPVKQKPKPYHHKDIIIKNDTIQIGGTLTWPKDQKADQLVIMITGSGMLNRNEEIHGISEFEPIAGYLTRHGIATYRYDDRGVGESTGNKHQSTLNLLVSDVKTIINHFSRNADHHFNEIVLLGHSQGGIIAGKTAAEDSSVDKIILMSSPSIKLMDVINYQMKENLEPFGLEKHEIQKTVNAYDRVLKTVRNGKDLDIAKNQYHQQYDKMMHTLPDSINSQSKKFIEMLGTGILRMSLTPMFESTNFYDPVNDLRKLTIPVLALFGGQDGKVLVSKNLPPMTAALDSADVSYQINVFKNANHSYVSRKARNNPSKYKNNPFVKKFLPTINEWLKRPGDGK